MEEYKFRVRFDNKFYYFTLDEIMERAMTYQGDWDLKALRSEKQQYIGLKDKNNKEIYTSDTVRALNRNYDCEDERETFMQTFEVTYLNGCFMFGNWNAHEFFNKFIHKEIIGDKYENIDLMEVK